MPRLRTPFSSYQSWSGRRWRHQEWPCQSWSSQSRRCQGRGLSHNCKQFMYLYILLLHIIFWMSPDGPTVLNMFLKHFLQVMVLLPGSFRKLRRPLPAKTNFHNYFYFSVQAISNNRLQDLQGLSRIMLDWTWLEVPSARLHCCPHWRSWPAEL